MKWYKIPDLKAVMDIQNITGANGVFVSDNPSIAGANAINFNTQEDFSGLITFPDVSDRDILSISNQGNEIFRFVRIFDTQHNIYGQGIAISPFLSSYISFPFFFAKYSDNSTFDYGIIGYPNAVAANIVFMKDDANTVDTLNLGYGILINGILNNVTILSNLITRNILPASDLAYYIGTSENRFFSIHCAELNVERIMNLNGPYVGIQQTLTAPQIGDLPMYPINHIYATNIHSTNIETTNLSVTNFNVDGTTSDYWIIDKDNTSTTTRNLYFGSSGPTLYFDIVNDRFTFSNKPVYIENLTPYPCEIRTSYNDVSASALHIFKLGTNTTGTALYVANHAIGTYSALYGAVIECWYGIGARIVSNMGSEDALQVLHGGTGNLIRGTVGNTDKFLVLNNGTTQTYQDFECLNSGYGLILRSPNGTRWRVTIDDTGNLITTPL